MQLDKLIINVALTGLVPMKAENPGLPITPEEIAHDSYLCYKAGASIFHLHARDEEGKPTYRAEVYREIIARVRGLCPDAIICVSTSGRLFKSFEERAAVLDLVAEAKPDMASLTLGSHNFPRQASVNDPDMIRALADKMKERGIVPELEVFDLGMIDYARYLIDKQTLVPPYHFNIILGSLGTLGATPFHLATMVRALPAGATWGGGGIGRFQFFVNTMAITMGGHVRVGLEDNTYYGAQKKDRATNLGLVQRLVNLAKAAQREISTPDEARTLIGLPPQNKI
jgi:3-keto-5-aminohexanoate cleavage enzyme